MSKYTEAEQDEVGYGKPPKSDQFKKGISGNPSGRPKKQSDFLSALLREANSVVPITEKGKRKAVKMIDVVAKQVTEADCGWQRFHGGAASPTGCLDGKICCCNALISMFVCHIKNSFTTYHMGLQS